jgi:hypothetical protein
MNRRVPPLRSRKKGRAVAANTNALIIAPTVALEGRQLGKPLARQCGQTTAAMRGKTTVSILRWRC